MADDFDVEAMLEAPYKKEDDNHGSRSDRKDRDRDRDRRKRSRSRTRRRSRSRDGRRNKESRRSRSKDRKHRAKESDRPKRRSFSRSPIRVHKKKDFTPEERDARTVVCMQLAAKIRPRDLEEFFSSVGKVNDCRLITDNKTRRSKGIAYVEFEEIETVALALGLSGQKLLAVPILVQSSQVGAEKNRLAAQTSLAQKGASGPMRLYVGSLHFNISEDMLRGIFDPFGKIDDIKLMKNHETGRSQGYGFITFHNAEDAKKALDQLNGFELAGRPMKVGHVTERTGDSQVATTMLDNDEMDRAGIDLGATGRLQLMAKLAEGTGFEIPQMAANALNMGGSSGNMMMPSSLEEPQQSAAPPIATQSFMLSNMFDPVTETSMTWDREIMDDVIEECNKHGGVLHIYVDKASPTGNVYVKCPSIAAAAASVNALHGRYFAGKVITAAYVPLPNYHALFPDAMRATQLILSSQQQAALANGGGATMSGMSQPPQGVFM